MNPIRAGFVVLAVAVLAEAAFSPEQLKAKYYYDLGPGQVDVSSYPEAQRANYAVFSKTCSQCHTLARPINSPIKYRRDWNRYVERMHARSSGAGKPFAREDTKAIVDFLSYDSRVRKIGRRAEFEERSAFLKKLFEEVLAARRKAEEESNLKKARPYFDPASVTPREQ
ncbi:MAG: hypothetical protein HY921_07495 [Elusimicrobia bacterium]|nr:hypothetical protein [Elusimicrobiota bacterium]